INNFIVILVPMVHSPKKCQPRPNPAPYKRKPKTPHQKDGRKNLTLTDWLVVFAYIDEHPDLPQDHIVQHFKTRKEGMLGFTQATLERRYRREELQNAKQATLDQFWNIK
ncbi:hypothetical protein DFH29DRAFT_965098, partial [Suillus ampliporus]